LLRQFRVVRVAADPPRAPDGALPGGWPGLAYYRLHGSPRPYFSPYGREDLESLTVRIRAHCVPVWCIFDNTGSGAAAGNALDLASRLAAGC